MADIWAIKVNFQMGALNGARGTSFNQLLNIIKGIQRQRGSNPGSRENLRILAKIRELAPSIPSLMREHPSHIPVILHHLSSLTSGLPGTKPRECVTGTVGKLDAYGHNSCKTCSGLCNEVFGGLVSPIRSRLAQLGPKGLSQVMSVYSSCRDPGGRDLIRELQLRMCYFIYSGCKRMPSCSEGLDSLLLKHRQLLKHTVRAPQLSHNDYLARFCNPGPENLDSLPDQSHYYLPVNLMDICTTLEATARTRRGSGEESNGSGFSEPESYTTGITGLLLDLSFRFLSCSSFTGNRAAGGPAISFTNRPELDTVCRLVGLFKKLKYMNELMPLMIVGVLKTELEALDFRNLVTLLDCFSHYGLQSRDSAQNIDNNSSHFTQTLADSIDFERVISRIGDLCEYGDLSFLRSLSTVTHVMSRIAATVAIPSYGKFRGIIKDGLKKYISRNPESLSSSESVSAIAMLVQNLPDPECINLLCKLFLDNRLPFHRMNLFDFNVILELLIKTYSGSTTHNHTADSYNNESYPRDGSGTLSPATPNSEDNASCKIDRNDLGRRMCLLITEFSLHFSALLSDKSKVQTKGPNYGKKEGLSGRHLREMCYFLRNLGLFSKLDLRGTAEVAEALENVSRLTKLVESYFMSHHTSLSDVDHRHISHFLATQGSP